MRRGAWPHGRRTRVALVGTVMRRRAVRMVAVSPGTSCYSCDGARKELWRLVDVGAVSPCAW
jgi:hypothetical protein